MRIAVIGAGPAGLYFALLMKKHDSRHEIRVYEQNEASATYGWGVVFSDVALSFLRQIDEEFYRDFTAAHEQCEYMEIVHHSVRVQVHSNRFSRVSRIELLRTLHAACQQAGVQVTFGTRIEDVETLARDVDVLVGADGANSLVRSQLGEHFQPSFESRRNRFAWYGTHQLFHPVSLIFRESEHGVFIAHAYQYSKTLSTFLVEVDPDTWQRAGLDHAMDEQSRRYCEQVFRRELGSNELLSNRSIWFQATIVRNARWSHKNIILLGDALRTVHFSLGSGTRMAMQDAAALQTSFVVHGADIQAAFGAFEAQRRPTSSEFQAAAARSLDWYETVGNRLHLDPVSFAYDYMRRTGRVTHEDLRSRDPVFVARYEAALPETSDAQPSHA
jgi:2-polyprenyl-6-methoxyphenol hydroxylase-like FAD-dependent oxidoreductase